MIIDSFLDGFEGVRRYCDKLEYKSETNPADQVEYKGINLQIPLGLQAECIYKIQKATGLTLKDSFMFFRMSKEGETVPHQAHTDELMGDVGIIVYLNRAKHCQGGTSFLRHKETGMTHSPQGDDIQIWERDVNNYDAWEPTEYVSMVPNRALIFDCKQLHRAELPNSFGSNNYDSRLILCGFFHVC